MNRGRAVSVAWTTLVLLCATAALAGIVGFMAWLHRGWNGSLDDDGIGRTGSPGVEAPAAHEGPGGDRTAIGPGRAHPVDERGVARPRGSDAPSMGTAPAAVATALRARRLTVPVAGVSADALVPSFGEARGERAHEALDIMAPAGTPVVAVEDGTVAKLFSSQAGGLTVYQFDPSRSVAYYYAHLQGYAAGLDDGDTLRRGQVIGYVGSTGNADPKAPHLHFAIFRLGPERRWWEGTAIDPYLVLR